MLLNLDRILTLSADKTAAMEASDTQKMMILLSARAQKVKMNYYWNLWMQATRTKMTQRTVKVKRKMSCLKETG